MDQYIRTAKAGKEDKQLKFTIAIFTIFLLGITTLAGVGQTSKNSTNFKQDVQIAQRA